MKKLMIIFIFFSSILKAEEKNSEKQLQSSYQIMADIDFSAFSGAQNILSFHEYLERSFSYVMKAKPKKGVISTLLRVLEFGLIWNPLSEVETVVQHEVFGHGYRIRDIGSGRVKVESYEIDLPLPYGSGGGATNYLFNSNLTSFQKVAITLAGVEATAILANRLKMKWMESLRLDPKKAPLYLQAHFDLINYVLSMQESFWLSDIGHDIKSYILWLNNTYFEDELTESDLKNAVLVNFLDPMTYLSIGAYFYYIFTAKDIKIPMIDIKGVKFLPNFRLSLAPYGIEYFLENFFSYYNRAIYAYLRVGKHDNNTYWGVGVEYPKMYKFNLNTLGFRFDFFRQPKIYSKEALFVFEGVQVGYFSKQLHKMIYGMSFSIIYDRKFSKKSKVSIFTEVGYKTRGYIPGFSLDKDIIFRLGIGFCSF